MGMSGPRCWHTEGLARPDDDPVCRAAEETVLHNDAPFVALLPMPTVGDTVQGEEVTVSSHHCVRLRIVAILGDQLRLKQDKCACSQSRRSRLQCPAEGRRALSAAQGLFYSPLREDVLCAMDPPLSFFQEGGRKSVFLGGTSGKFAFKLNVQAF
jgi:hypothetical protein